MGLALKYIKRYLLNLLYVTDLVANTILLGDPDETISSRVGKKAARNDCRVCKWLCYWLDKVDPRHCSKSIKTHEGRGSDDDDSVLGI